LQQSRANAPKNTPVISDAETASYHRPILGYGVWWLSGESVPSLLECSLFFGGCGGGGSDLECQYFLYKMTHENVDKDEK
jgi:hypothetical protein